MTKLLTLVKRGGGAGRRLAPGVRLALSALAAAGVACAIVGTSGESAPPPRAPAALTPMVGVFSGEFADGLPVYRLPSVTVVAERSAEPAAIRREDRSTGAERAQRDHAAKAEAAPADKATGVPGARTIAPGVWEAADSARANAFAATSRRTRIAGSVDGEIVEAP